MSDSGGYPLKLSSLADESWGVPEPVLPRASSTVGCNLEKDFPLQMLLGVQVSEEVASADLTTPLLGGVGVSDGLELGVR